MINLVTKVKLKQYYVYIHRRGDNNEVFYVGKGKGRRCKRHESRSNYWRNIYNKYGVNCEIVGNSLTEHEALLLEKTLVRHFGRIDLGTGCLVNLTDGGDGASNIIVTEETRKRLAEIWRGRKHKESSKLLIGLGNKGKVLSDETKAKLSASRTGSKWSSDQRKIILEKKSKFYKNVICIETGEVYESAVAASKVINGDPSLISKVCRGVRPAYRGLHWKFVKDLESSDS